MTNEQLLARIALKMRLKVAEYEIKREESRDNIHIFVYYGSVVMAMMETINSISEVLKENS